MSIVAGRGIKAFRECLSESGLNLEMISIPAGTFLMGSTDDDPMSYSSEKPQHEVTVKPFFMGKFPVTQAQYEAVMGSNPTIEYDHYRFVSPNKPVVNVNWHDAAAFCSRLSSLKGRKYRLPTEAEWEYACRAGTTTSFYFGETIGTDLANYDGSYTFGDTPKGEYRNRTVPVGVFPPNAWGLYEMHGNVWEWCLDHWHENYYGAPADGSNRSACGDSDLRVARGGSWYSHQFNCRSASRIQDQACKVDAYTGFRVVCEVA